ncbi:MAG TPA: TetR/AcrR family transcriptional regulator [Nocardioides sp.]|uniref:TetR/AcrR family transcriptional regulator n=1 Tax=Nocardioides sp. TaxID=35761 RepID=UPI002D8000BF|nr:TetR/AcrR family transcriptional regulator [Nocardioides sp.]HET6654253.1 TetR/AcrR family transcriptional regulator [Nocardioides sp.]
MALTRQQVLLAAVELADRDGLASLSMRSLARHVGVEAMSLYHHVANKEALLDGMVDVVFSEMHLPRTDGDWADEMRKRSASGREALTRHRWAIGLMDSRSAPGPDTLRHHDAVLGCLRAGGFPVRLAAHAFAVLDAYLYGFMVQELSLPLPSGTDIAALADQILASMPVDSLPHLAELTREVVLKPGYAFGDEFEFGLELVLDGLTRRLAEPAG